MPILLHFGCGMRKIDGMINVDVRREVRPNIVDDLRQPTQFSTGVADLIYSCHVLEHFPRNEVQGILSRWRDILKPGGILRLSVPDIRACCLEYLCAGDFGSVQNLVYGSQRHAHDFHYNGWDERSLSTLLTDVGFSDPRTWDWRRIDWPPPDFDDYRRAYLPHKDFDNGRLMSLNMEATK